jgi:hypothetical protein
LQYQIEMQGQMDGKWKTLMVCAMGMGALAVFFFWFMSPYEQCVRAEAALNTERLIKLRDEQETLLPGEYRSDDEIWDEQKRQAVLTCRHNST